ncbi:MAG: HAMP domain-containing sensor histidine kinase [Bacteroidota bacterium]
MSIPSVLIIAILAMLCVVLFAAFRRAKQKNSELQKAHSSTVENNDQLVKQIERVKEELQLIRLKAGESDRLKAAFLSNMSHELRTPLHAIMGFAGLIANPTLPEEDKVAYAKIINHSVDALLQIISDIFDISQFESGLTNIDIESVNIHELLDTLETWVNHEKTEVGKEEIDVKIIKANHGTSFYVQTDAYKLKRALNHLVSNALKYSNDGIIEIGYIFSEKDTIDFYVKDEGIGFENDKMELMLSQFRQGDEGPTRQYGGLGLGLTLAQKFAAMLQGHLWAKSQPENGSTFFISIPYKKQ